LHYIKINHPFYDLVSETEPMDITRGYAIKGKSRGKLKHWSSLLDEWSANIERYMKFTGGDVPYWYKERANVSILAGAAWRSGFIALQEFEAEKQTPEGKSTDQTADTWKGRCDLYIGSATNQHDLVEAKYKWLSLNSNSFVERANKLVDKALADAQDSKCGSDISSVGVAFIPVYAHSKHTETIDALIQKNLEQVATIDLDAYAWCFPPSMRQHILDDDYINPGILLLAKIA
jgi:hypothetical protein